MRVGRNYSISKIIHPLILLIICIILWQKATAWFGIKPYLLPSPQLVLESIVANWSVLIEQTFITGKEVLASFFIASIAGIFTGTLIYSVRVVRNTLYPFVVFFQGFPKIALAPLIIVWFGYGMLSKVVIGSLFAFFPLVIATIGGLSAAPGHLVEHFEAMNASRWRKFLDLYIPAALPAIMDGFKLAMPLSVIGTIVGEFVGSSTGLGHLIMATTANARTDYMFAAILSVAVMAGVFYFIIELAAKRVWWRGL